MIHDDLVAPINDQITSEAYASQLYLQMSMWAEDKGLPGASKFFRGHVAEEMDHRNRLVDYLVAHCERQPDQSFAQAVFQLAEALKDWVRTRLARYKYPREVVFVDSLPRNDRGKVDKKRLPRD